MPLFALTCPVASFPLSHEDFILSYNDHRHTHTGNGEERIVVAHTTRGGIISSIAAAAFFLISPRLSKSCCKSFWPVDTSETASIFLARNTIPNISGIPLSLDNSD